MFYSTDRIILHSDLNAFYANVEVLHNSALTGKPVAVCGDAELRHGIVLSKTQEAKEAGVKTGDTIWEAQKKCKDLVVVTANFPRYIHFSALAREIYERYTNQIESFGIDECWLDITGCEKYLKLSPCEVADEIREVMKAELGCSVSIGISWNKIFAKLGSDMKKPDATTLISRKNYVDTVYRLPVEDLLYVGRATKSKLHKYGITTIGDLARRDIHSLKQKLGKWGEHLWVFANGLDCSPVMTTTQESVIKSIGNSTTTMRDLTTAEEIEMIVTVLAESVAARLREQHLKGHVVSLTVTDKNFEDFGKQKKLAEPTYLAADIISSAMTLFKENYTFSKPVRSVGIKLSDLSPAHESRQLTFLYNEKKKKTEEIELAIDDIRRRFGHNAVHRANLYLDRGLTNLDPKTENTIHPKNFFKG